MTKIFIAGHNGMVGSAILNKLKYNTNNEIITKERCELDLTNQSKVNYFFETHDINQVYLAAAKVGGIHANNEYPADFIYQNIMIQSNIINAAHNNGIQKLLFLGSSCIYPKNAIQPMNENVLLSGQLEPTNEPYAIAKIAGIKLCESFNRQYGRDYRSVMPTNLYGRNDNFHAENSHVIPALIRRFHEAKLKELPSVTAWGSGLPKREFLSVDEMASASIFVMNVSLEKYKSVTDSMLSHINVGTGIDITIKELTETIARVVGYKGLINWDTSKPDGPPRKLMDVTKLQSIGWKADKKLEQGLKETYDWFKANIAFIRK